MAEHHHYILHKPFGYISQFISNAPKSHKQKFLGELYDFAEGTMSIGRLDQKSEGLLLLSTDGKLSAEITGRGYEKEYYVQLDGLITEEAIAQLQQPMTINVNGDMINVAPAKARIIEDPGFEEREPKVRDDRHGPTSWASIIINEGKYRQVRKMCAAVNFPVLRLVRVRIGKLELGNLKNGEVIEVDQLLV
ncbi:pseudouridine synthase [Paracrocinitomix mangrovi]|uniref:pseudouridine synthase n=1 Tax=Paracrocinitomix mangrovi TaxID=2862509 RepID=UPI001C8DAFAF|nr:pseudouridine synthase [Paracrocinitomix mangrovi]UKN00299.1 pseudouridine synthase [Paracrocinitomix mangrovi]